MQELATVEFSALDELIGELVENPQNRKTFVALGRQCEELGLVEESNSFYNGLVPNTIIEKYSLKEIPSRASQFCHGFKRLGWYNEEFNKWSGPKNICDSDNSVFKTDSSKMPVEFIDTLESGKFVYDGVNLLVLDAENHNVANHSSPNSYLLYHHAVKNENTSKELISGISILLSARNSGNFYHWHYDILPALSLLEASGILLKDIQNVIITDKESSFQTETLKILGFTENQIKVISCGKSIIECEQLLLVKNHNRMGMSLSRRHIDWLRHKFIPLSFEQIASQQISPNDYPEKIFIVRKIRGFSNSSFVEKELIKMGYVPVSPECMPYLNQVTLFNRATHIVAPHGAGLTLLGYCSPGTIVHEIYGEHVHPCFWTLAERLGLQYYCYNCSDISDKNVTNGGKGLETRRDKAIYVNESVLEEIGINS